MASDMTEQVKSAREKILRILELCEAAIELSKGNYQNTYCGDACMEVAEDVKHALFDAIAAEGIDGRPGMSAGVLMKEASDHLTKRKRAHKAKRSLNKLRIEVGVTGHVFKNNYQVHRWRSERDRILGRRPYESFKGALEGKMLKSELRRIRKAVGRADRRLEKYDARRLDWMNTKGIAALETAEELITDGTRRFKKIVPVWFEESDEESDDGLYDAGESREQESGDDSSHDSTCEE